MIPQINTRIHLSPTNNFRLITSDKNNPLYNKTSTFLLTGFDNKPQKVLIENKNKEDSFPIRLKKMNNFYKVGPIVGILTVFDKKGLKGNKQNFIDLIKYGMRTGVLIFVFPAESLDQEKRLVDGYFYLPAKKIWLKRKMPLPDLVYNRLPSRNDEKKPEILKVINFFISEKIPLFNPNYFDKLTLNNWMKNSKNYNHLLPETVSLNKINLCDFLNKYSMLYLKPVHGKAGLGFIKIEKSTNFYKLTYQNKNVLYRNVFLNINTLWNKINYFTSTKKYIIQRGIQLKTYNGHPYDIRILVQKNDKGNWRVSGIGCRIAGENSITTHVPRGGFIMPINDVLIKSFGDTFSKWKVKINDISIELAKHIEKSSKSMLGEISIDLGIDQSNNIWFFEANSKPMKFDEPSIRATSLLRLMQYFCYLTGFNFNYRRKV